MRPRFLSLTDDPAIALFLVGSSLALAGCDPATPTSSSSASRPSFSRDSARAGAVVIRNTGCALFDGTGHIILADRDISILTPSARQNSTFICKVKKVSNPTGRAVRYDSENNPLFPGLECDTFSGPTTTWSETISKSGNARLSCHFNNRLSPPDTVPPPDTLSPPDTLPPPDTVTSLRGAP
jgi:hypothetical protein